MLPDPDSYRALARSSPWRWRTLHATFADSRGEVEAWVSRPGQLLVREPGGRMVHASGLPYTYSTLRVVGGDASEVPPEVLRHRLPHEVEPVRRPDGLVAERPGDGIIDYDDPMYRDYRWVAMLDPVELGHHVRVEDLREDEVAGRPVWRAFLVAEDGYLPRCGGNCCELLYSEAGLMSDFSDDPSRVPEEWRGRDYPDGYDVALDVQTGVVASLAPIGGDQPTLAFTLTILEVDAGLADVFASYSSASRME